MENIASESTVLSARKISKYFHEPEKFKVLKEVSFNVSRGEFLTLIGKSGCGKSTLLYCLSTMDTDYEGELFIDNQRITGKKQHQLAALRNDSIGFIFQFHYLLPEFSCLKNVMIPALKLAKYSPREIESRAYDRLKLLGLEDQALKPAAKLSGGQQQRVSIARALINDPKIILCDEPTGNLDSKNTAIVFNTFKELTKTNRQTIIAVTHDLDFAKNSDRTVEMADGRIVYGNS
jgi:lipoprotein-releasing system ATP-binding protein